MTSESLKIKCWANEGTDLYQPILDKTITHLMDYQNPLRQNIARKRGYSNEWELDRRNVSSTAAEFVAEDGTGTAGIGLAFLRF